MKILLIHSYYQYWGGEDNYFESLIKLLKKKGHEVILFTKYSKNIGKYNLWKKIRVALGMLFWNREVEKELTQIIKNYKPNVAHFQNIHPLITFTAYKVCKKYRIPIVQRVSNYRMLCPNGTLYRKNKICDLCVRKIFYYPSILYGCYHRSKLSSVIFCFANPKKSIENANCLVDRFIFPTEFIRDYHLRYINLNKEKTSIIPNFILSKKNNYKRKEGNYFVYIGRLSEEKGIIFLLEAFKNLPSIKLFVIGDGPLKKVVTNYFKYKNIYIKGYLSQEKISKYLSNAIATIIPSQCLDVFPNVLLESYANGVIVVAPETGSFVSIIKNTITGILYKENNINDFSSKIIQINKYKQNYIKLGSLIKNEYTNNYSEEKHYKLLMEIYRKLLLTKC